MSNCANVCGLPKGKSGGIGRGKGMKDKKQQHDGEAGGNGIGGDARKKGGGQRTGTTGDEIRQMKWRSE